ncbi:DNA mismatch repair protein MutS [Richelia intracellularis HH01]|uniref:DNA mismatch repair protein MutS n=1 Tax=Richelia intracellularis HH01 TaxID=1165094 RepID=M1X352_9NOST|nr:DNA mismatch repair protein MutS [Richelia intracellularis]CCH67970.1 DNA mismatch repair protein MutS [Richelia intracellularis HH01]HAE06619.1 DNA mismatch repair protein MutS [Richelia sp.]
MTAFHSGFSSETDSTRNIITDTQQIDITKLSQMYQHYVEVKHQHLHAILLYRVGDFFECYFQDAVKLAQELELVLTSKQAGELGKVAMSGIPHYAWERYATCLVEKGYSVVICDQMETAAEAAGRLLRREVTRILTPGTILEDGMLKCSHNNYLAAVVIIAEDWSLAYADISTGEYWVTQDSNLELLTQELMRLQPAEVLFPTNTPDVPRLLRPGETSDKLPECLPSSFCYSLRPQTPFTPSEARMRLLNKFKVLSMEGFGCEHLPLAVRAAGGLLEYLEETQKNTFAPLQPLRTYMITDYLIIDYQTRRNLEITRTIRDNKFHGSLLWALDRTSTPMGGRTLRRWLMQPLLDIQMIQARQYTIEELVKDTPLRQGLRYLLKQIYDLERLVGRAGSGTANGRDLVALADSLAKLPELALLANEGSSPFLRDLQQVPPVLEELSRDIRFHLVELPPSNIKEGGLIREGVNHVLDERKLVLESDQQWIANLELEEREHTGISNLRVGFNKTFGYYISISRSKTNQVPENYIRKQTLTNEERYIIPELKEREARILTALDDLNQLEYEIFVELRSRVGKHAEAIRQVSKVVAALDVLCGLAELSVYQDYCRPEIVRGREILITDGRHPVVEQSLPAGFFVPNSTILGVEEEIGFPSPEEFEEKTIHQREQHNQNPSNSLDLVILTGPNASGKSCYLRQVGLIQIMAQIGSFIPAKSAKLGMCDRIFTRVGAVDDLATGQSTFMVEMNETANILNHATSNSLVLLDEIGRGTATFDGLSIAWAVAEYIATDICSRTIFATHYHEMNQLAVMLHNVANYQVVVRELSDRIIFLHQVQPGAADKSYGIEVGKLAGLPSIVINRAKQVMEQIEKHSKIAIGLKKLDGY